MTETQLREVLHLFIDGENPNSGHNGLARKSYNSSGYTLEQPFLFVKEEADEIHKFVTWYMKEVHNAV